MDESDDTSPATSPLLCALPDDKMKELEREAAIRAREERLKTFLNPMERFVMSVQSLLVWEKLQPSAVMFVCANIVFWLAVTTNQRVVFIAAAISFLVVCIETFRYQVWPNMQVKPKDPQEDDWTPLHVRLLSVPELCEYLARAWQMSDDWYTAFWDLRRKEPAKFCTYTCCLCLTIACIGYYIPGVIISYFLMVCMLLWPAFIYHDVSGQLYAKLQPLLKQFEQSMDSLERREKRHRRHRRSSRNADQDDRGSSDSDLNEFCPTPGPAVDAALFHAASVVSATPSSSCQGTPTYGLVGGILPRGGSVEFTDDELNTDNESNNLLAGLRQMPSFQDRTLDPSGDELDSAGNGLQGRQEDSRKIHPPSDLFGTLTDEDFGDHELDTPESPLDGSSLPPVGRANEHRTIPAAGGSSQFLQPDAAKLLSQTVAAVMSEAITSLATVGREENFVENPKQRHPSLPVKSAQASGSGTVLMEPIPSGLTPSPQSDLDLAEFEMLDSSELDNASNQTTEDERSPSSESSPSAINAGISYLSSFFTRKK